jgi:transcriptional regulator NrdR family protein
VIEYPSKITASVGDIIKINYPACYAKVIELHKSTTTTDNHKIKYRKICDTSFRFFTKPRIHTRPFYIIPFKVEKESFNTYIKSIYKFLAEVKE